MIIDKNIEIKINAKTFKHYKKLGYNFSKVGEKIKINVEHLPSNSHEKILCSCDICGFETHITIGNYNKYIRKDPDKKYTCKKCNLNKRKQSCLKKYGTEFASQNTKIKDKVKQTMLDKGIEFFWCRKEEYKNRIKELYGLEHISKCDEIKEKKIQTCLKNHGVKFPSQNIEIHEKQQKSSHCLKYHSSGLYYRGSYEKHFIDFCNQKNIQIENIKDGIKYTYQNKERIYFPDFYYKPLNLIIEIKSNYTYLCELENNLIKKEAVINNGFSFIFVINKDYNDFENLTSRQNC